MTPSEDESSSEGGSEDRVDLESSVTPSSSSTPNALTNRWCIKGIQDIYMESTQQREQGKLARTIYEEPKVIVDRLDGVPGLQDMMIGHGL